MNIVARTDIGQIRLINQDCVKVVQKDDHEALVILCDGMGGHKAGEIASALACDVMSQMYLDMEPMDDEVSIRIWLYQSILNAHHRIYKEASLNEDYEGMGTTVVAALIKDGYVYISHVGDSRAYLFNGELEQLTNDDTLVNALLHAGTISKEEALSHPKKNVLLQAVGVSDDVHPSFMFQQLKGCLLLCSDGLYNSLSHQRMVELFQQSNDLNTLCDQLIQEANDNGGKDNIGIVLVNEGGLNRDSNEEIDC